VTGRLRFSGVVGLVLGVFLMHGLSGPNMSHDGLPGLGSTSHAMGDMKSSGPAHSHSEAAAMLTMACAYAVLQLSVSAARREAPMGERPSITGLRIPIGPLRGPEPPVPRIA
jgi:hypothetical protein